MCYYSCYNQRQYDFKPCLHKSHLNALQHKSQIDTQKNRDAIDSNLDGILDFTVQESLKLTLNFTAVPKIMLKYVKNIEIISTQDVLKLAHFNILYLHLISLCHCSYRME